MAIVLQNPPLFYTIDTAIQVISMLIALLIVGFSYKAYRFTKDKRYYYYSVAFVLIAASFFIRALSNLIIYFNGAAQAKDLLPVFNLGVFAFRILTLLAFTGIMLMTLKISNRKVISLLIIFSLIASVFSRDHYTEFYLLYIIILGFTTAQLYMNYQQKKSRLALATFGIFGILTMAQLFFLLLVIDVFLKLNIGRLFYYAGQAFQIISYLILFYVMIRISRR